MKAAERRRQQRCQAESAAEEEKMEAARADLALDLTRAYAEADSLEIEGWDMPAATLPPIAVVHLLSTALEKATRGQVDWLNHCFLHEDGEGWANAFRWTIRFVLRTTAARDLLSHKGLIEATVCRAQEMLGLDIVVYDEESAERTRDVRGQPAANAEGSNMQGTKKSAAAAINEQGTGENTVNSNSKSADKAATTDDASCVDEKGPTTSSNEQ